MDFSLWQANFYDLCQMDKTKAGSNMEVYIYTFLYFFCVFLEHLYLETNISDSVKGHAV